MRTLRMLPLGGCAASLLFSGLLFLTAGCDSSTGKPGEMVKVDEAAEQARQKNMEDAYKKMYTKGAAKKR